MGIMDMFSNKEAVIQSKEALLASYYCHRCSEKEVIQKAKSFCIGQTIGTWVDIPLLTERMRSAYLAEIVHILRVPPADMKAGESEQSAYLITLAFPQSNFGDSISMLLTALLGNDASTSSQLKLVELTLPQSCLKQFKGPKYGIEGIRSMTGIYDRPLVLNMIKPCIGLSPEEGASVFYETALGGMDIIKDDELLGNPPFSPLRERITAYRKAAARACEESGKRTLYAANVTDRAERMLDNARMAEALGADMVMVNYAVAGYSMLEAVSECVSIPVLGHYAGSGYWSESPVSGIAAELANGKLPRLCGADIAIINTSYGKYPISYPSYMGTAQMLTTQMSPIKRSFAGVGGGVHPGMVSDFAGDLGNDMVLACGGAVQGHPDGAGAGSRAMLAAAKAAGAGMDIQVMAQSEPALQRALALWN